MLSVTLCLHRKRIKQGLVHVTLHFSKTNDASVMPPASMAAERTSPSMTRLPRGCHALRNEYEMSASDLNYGFGVAGSHHAHAASIGSQKFKQTFPAKINHFHLTSFLKELAVFALRKWKQKCNFHWKFRQKKLVKLMHKLQAKVYLNFYQPLL